MSKEIQRLEVEIELPHSNGLVLVDRVCAYLTDEGIVIDAFVDDEVVTSSYEFFAEAGMQAPRKLED